MSGIVKIAPHTGEEEILDRISGGDRAALQQLYSMYRDGLYSYCYRLVGNKEDAEDAVHETFIKIFFKSSTVQNAASLKGWIFTVARNEAYGCLRKKRYLTPLDEEVWETETPLDLLIGAQQSSLMEQVLNDLKPEYREVIVLCEYNGFSYQEISEVTTSTISAVKSRLFKARKAIAQKLSNIL